MLRLTKRIFGFSRVSVVDGSPKDVQGLENISSLPFYQSFKEGLNLTLGERLEEANLSFEKALNELEGQKEELAEHYLHIHKKITKNNIALGKIGEAEKNLYGVIRLRKKHQGQSMAVYDDYNALNQLFLRFNPQKAIVLGRALLSEKQADSMPLRHKKQFLFNLGNAYFLMGNYSDAKARFSECIESDPNPLLKVKALNNLALACWWHKNPLVASEEVESAPHRTQMVDSQFKQTRSLFLKALERAENPVSLTVEKDRFQLEQMLAEQEFSSGCRLREASSVLPLYNLIQFYINNEPGQRMKILCWLRVLLDLTQRTGRHAVHDEVYATLCVLNNDRQELQKFVKTALGKYSGMFEELYFTRLLSLLEGDREKGEGLRRRVLELEKRLAKEDPHVFKRKYLEQQPLVL